MSTGTVWRVGRLRSGKMDVDNLFKQRGQFQFKGVGSALYRKTIVNIARYNDRQVLIYYNSHFTEEADKQ